MKNYGCFYAIAAAALFGASTPFSKILLAHVGPWMLAGVLYFGSGLGLSLLYGLQKKTHCTHESSLRKKDFLPLAGATLFGGILGPSLLMLGLSRTQAAGASLLLNFEGVFTATLAWLVFKEHFDRRIGIGMLLILIGGLALSWSGHPSFQTLAGPLCVAGACLAWGIDNNLTRKISASDPVQIAMVKSLAAGSTNIALAAATGVLLPPLSIAIWGSVIGFFCYGLSLVLFVLALRNIGTARTGAYFSMAPFVGAFLSLIVTGDHLSTRLLLGAALMGLGVWLHLTERHEHEHLHEEMEHDHSHVHDEHHRHEHALSDPPGEPHTHAHKHLPLRHRHSHFPDIHHRHSH